MRPDINSSSFSGSIKINLTWKDESKIIELHAHHELEIDEANVKIRLVDANKTYVEQLVNDDNHYYRKKTS